MDGTNGSVEMASTSSPYDSVITDPLETSPATTILTTIRNEDLKWIWFVVPFATALIIFVCFECIVLVLLCRRNRYRKARQLHFTDAVRKPRHSTDDLNENVVLSGYRGIRTSISSTHETRGHFASTEHCSVCGNTSISRDGLMGTSTFRGYRDHRRHTRDGLLLYGEPPVNRSTFKGTMDDAESSDGPRYAGEPSYNPRQISRAFRELSSVSDIYTARSTDPEDDTYTPHFTPTVSRSISEDLADSQNAIDERALPSIERIGRRLATQAQNYDSVYRQYHGNCLDSSSTSSNLSDDQLLNVKPSVNTFVKTNGHRVGNFLDHYFVNRGRPNNIHSRDPIVGKPVLTSIHSVTLENERGDDGISNPSMKLHGHHKPLHVQEEDTRHFIETYLANSCENVSVTAYSNV